MEHTRTQTDTHTQGGGGGDGDGGGNGGGGDGNGGSGDGGGDSGDGGRKRPYSLFHCSPESASSQHCSACSSLGSRHPEHLVGYGKRI